jgi:hypothetical protein
MQIDIRREDDDLIVGEIKLGRGMQLDVYRSWESAQWYFYGLRFIYDGEYIVEDTDNNYPIPADSELGQALSQAVAQEASAWAPAL